MRDTVATLAVALATLMVLASCGGKGRARLGESCAADSDCESGVCFEGQCWPGGADVAVGVALHVGTSNPEVTPGADGTVSLDVTVEGPLLKPAALSASGLPEGVTAVFDPAELQSSGTSKLTLTVPASVAAGTYDFGVTATSGPYSQSAALKLLVSGPTLAAVGQDCGAAGDCESGVCFQGKCWPKEADLGLSLVLGAGASQPAAFAGEGGRALDLGFDAASLAGLPPDVALAATGLGNGVTATFDPAAPAAPGAITLTLDVAAGQASGKRAFTATATLGPYSASADLTLTVTPPGQVGDPCAAPVECASGVCYQDACWPTEADLGLKVSLKSGPPGLAIEQGTSADVTLTVAYLAGAPGKAAPSVTDLPSGVSGTFAPTELDAPGDVVLTLAIPAAQAVAATAFTVHVALGPYSAGLGLTLTVKKHLKGLGEACTVGGDCLSGVCWGNACWPAAADVAIELGVHGASGTPKVPQGGSEELYLDITASGPLQAPVMLALVSRPAGVDVTFDPPSVQSPASTLVTATVVTNSDAPVGALALKVTATSGPYSGGADFTLDVLAASPKAAVDSDGLPYPEGVASDGAQAWVVGETSSPAWGADQQGDGFIASISGGATFSSVRIYGTSAADGIAALLPIPGQGAWFLGTWRKGDTSATPVPGMLDAYGDVVWARLLTPSPDVPFYYASGTRSSVMLPDGSLLIAGTAGVNPPGLGLVRIGTGGKLIAAKVATTSSLTPYGIAPISNGAIAGGTAGECGGGWFVVAVDDQGVPAGGFCIFTGQGSYIADVGSVESDALLTGSMSVAGVPAASAPTVRVARASLAGKPLWSLGLGSTDTNYQVESFGGHLAVVGQTVVLAQPVYDAATSASAVLVVGIDAASGKPMWGRTLSSTGSYLSASAVLTLAQEAVVMLYVGSPTGTSYVSLSVFSATGDSVASSVDVADAAGLYTSSMEGLESASLTLNVTDLPIDMVDFDAADPWVRK